MKLLSNWNFFPYCLECNCVCGGVAVTFASLWTFCDNTLSLFFHVDDRLNSKWDLRRLCKTVQAVALPRMVSVIVASSHLLFEPPQILY